MKPAEGKELLTTREVAEWLEIDPRTVRKYASSGQIPQPLRLGRGYVRWRRENIQALVDGTWKGGAS